jgi:hypothetical protein
MPGASELLAVTVERAGVHKECRSLCDLVAYWSK